MTVHHFFKFQSKNKAFLPYVQERGIRDAVGIEVPLSIYYGQWTVSDYWSGRYDSRELWWDSKEPSPSALKQVRQFFEVENAPRETRFWVFLPKAVYCLSPVSTKVVDGPPELMDEHGNTPKTMQSRIVLALRKSQLPEVFANLNTNQKYNRRTIAELTDAEHRVAEHLHREDSAQMRISSSEVFHYLSPLQFETLLFLIFVRNDRYASTWRGGTLEKYDLRVDLDQELRPFPKGSSYLQAKKKETKPARRSDDYWVVHTGESDFLRKLVGRDWIEERVRESDYLTRWLSHSMAFFDIDWA